MKKILLFILLFFSIQSFAQSFLDLNNTFIELYKKGAYNEALPIGIKAIEQAKKEYGTTHENYAIAVHNVAETYYKLTKYTVALPYYHLAVKTYAVATEKEEGKDIALCYNSIGAIFLNNKLYDSSAYYLEKSYSFFVVHTDEYYNQAIGVMNNLVDLYFPLKQFADAGKVFIKILPIIENKEGVFSANYQTTYTNLIYSLIESKNLITMKSWLLKMQLATMNKYGKNAAEYAEITYQLGSTYGKLKQFDSSIYFYKQAYTAYTFLQNSKPSNSLAFSANNIGLAYLELKQYDSSAKYFEISYDYFVKNATVEFDNAKLLMENLEEVYLPTNNHDKLILVYQKMLPLIETKYGTFEEEYFTLVNKIVKISDQQKQLQNLQMQLVKIKEKFEVQKKTAGNEWYVEYVYLLAKCYRMLEQNDAAILNYNKAIQLYSTVTKGVINKSISICNNDLGIIYLAMQKYDLAATYFQKSFDYFFNHTLTDYASLVVIGDNLMTVFKSNNRFLSIKKVCEQMLPIIEDEETKNSENYCMFLYNLCSSLRFVREYLEMEKNVQELITIRATLNGESSLEFAEALDYSGLCQTELNNFVKAETDLNKAFNIKNALGDKGKKSMILTYIALGNLKSAMGNYNGAYQYYGNAAKVYEVANDIENLDYLTILQSWGYTYIEGSRFADAKVMLNKVLQIQSKAEGENFSGNAAIFVSLANAEFQLNELSIAKEHVEKAMFIANQNKGLLNDVIATAKSIFALLEHKMGNSIKGVELMQESVDLNKQLYGESSSRVALTYTTFSLIYQEMGRYADAELVLKKAMEIQKKIFGTQHPEYAMSLMNLAMVKTMQGGNDVAVELLKESMNIYIKKGLAGTSNFIKILSNLTFIVDKLGLYDEAKKLQLQILGILDERKDTSSYIRYLVFNNLATTCIRLNEFNESIQYSKKALFLIEHSQGKKSIEYIKTSNNLILGYRKYGNITAAKQLTNELLVLCKEVLGNDAELLATIYFNEAIFANEENNYKSSATYLEKTTQILINNFKQNFYVLSEKEKLAWWQEKDYIFAFYPSLLVKYPDASQEIIENYINLQLQIKGFVLSDATVALSRARTSGGKDLVKLIDDWQASRTLLSKQLSLPISERYYKLDSLETIVNAAEKNINQKSAGSFSIQKNNTVSCKVLQASLKNDEAAIEFIRFPFYRTSTFTDTVRYAAIIIQKNLPPKFVSIGTEDQIKWCLTGGKNNSKETRVNTLYRSTIKKNESAETFAGDSLYSIVWKPLMPYLSNISSVSYSPDGLLHKVAFNALPMIAKEKLLIDEFRLNQYSSIRQLAEKSTQQPTYTSMYLMANPDFNTLTQVKNNNGSGLQFNATTSNTAWVALPGTIKEIEAIEKICVTKNVTFTAVSAAQASEEKFKSLSSKSPSILHLATHGFFLPDPKNKPNSIGENSYATADDPLLRSGIIMAGANKAWSGEQIPFGVEDGIVTAYEIAQLDLSKTQLVALSACETALGDLQGSEGVFGLQRAFKIAGVKNLIVSLWQVPDKETAELMTLFYSNLFVPNANVREAFNKAQREMRSKYPPFSWAAFVLIE